MHSPPGGQSVKILNNGVVSCYPSRSLVHNAIDGGLAVVECTLWEWAWLEKNTAGWFDKVERLLGVMNDFL